MNVWLVWVLAAETKSENDRSESEGPQEVAEIKESEEVAPRSESNGGNSEPKQETVQENDSGSGRTFSYDQLKAKSDNPVTGIDFKRREVVSIMNALHFIPYVESVLMVFFPQICRPICQTRSSSLYLGLPKKLSINCLGGSKICRRRKLICFRDQTD